MIRYAAFLRGIMPGNPNMRNEKLRMVFESLGFANVRTVISSGNVLFESRAKNLALLESKIERALTAQLGIDSAVFIRSIDELRRLIEKDPFKGLDHGRESYLMVTFIKKKPREIFNTITDIDPAKATDMMKRLEKEHGKAITTRTWKTVQKMAA